MNMTDKLNLGIGYTIDTKNGKILAMSHENYGKNINERYREIVKFLLEEYAKSNNMKLEDITFI